MPGRGWTGAAGIEGRGALSLAARSGRGGTTGRATGWPARGRCCCGEGAPGVAETGRGACGVEGRSGAEGRGGAGDGGAPGAGLEGNDWRGPLKTCPGRGVVGSGLAVGAMGLPGANTADGGV